jgi:hypothetical protein
MIAKESKGEQIIATESNRKRKKQKRANYSNREQMRAKESKREQKKQKRAKES